jgi:hypothetical protein
MDQIGEAIRLEIIQEDAEREEAASREAARQAALTPEK